ncbi:EAL domain-containing protein [Pseudocolwellia sp. HL-MZ19]|uniref:EAL domain-containing protein n=1 Tax=unclassified Pseudocolwellia TaxID=2848178 RepID=UPI003CF75409
MAAIFFQAEKAETISNFRAIPIYLSENKVQAYTRHSHEDSHGYLWSAGSAGLLRYDGYKNKKFDFQESTNETDGGVPYIFTDSRGSLWIANTYLYRFDDKTEKFEAFSLGKQYRITTMTEDAEGNLWLFNSNSDVFKFDITLNKLISTPFYNETIDSFKIVKSSVYDKANHTIWFTSEQGVYGFDLLNEKLIKVTTLIDKYFLNFLIRDMTLDAKRNTLWVGTPKGALRINTMSLEVKLYTAEDSYGSLPISDVSVTFVDSANNVWLGLEKAGLCVFKHLSETFMCIEASLDGEYKLPVATVEDISEDSNGSLWLSMNQYGLFRLTPDLEKFNKMRDSITNSDKGYFKNSFDGIVRENKDIWIATDGGGINIFNYQTGIYKSIKHDPKNPNSLSSNSVISLTEDENGFIWAGTWAGGVSKVDPETMMVERFINYPDALKDQTIAGNNVFVVESDQKGGIWISVWGWGLQYLNVEDGLFTNFIYGEDKGEHTIQNTEISHLQLFNEQLWITGKEGLEVLDIKTQTFKILLDTDDFGFTFVWVKSLEEIWIGTFNGLIRFNAITKAKKVYTTEDGLPSNEISYLRMSDNNRVWVATSNGLSVLDLSTNEFTNYTKKEGMVGNQMSTHGEFIEVENLLYVPSKSGITIINPDEMPNNHHRPKTIISDIAFINPDTFITDRSTENKIKIPISANSIKFEFVALNFIFPEYNQYKYRLIGLQSDFVQTKSNERFARFTNLPAGDYTFEVYGANGTGVWDNDGDSFSFTILPAWWTTWWAKLLFSILFLMSVFLIYKWRFSLNRKREKDLQRMVEDKTNQLQSYATELKRTSQSLVNLNSELENRVEKRTVELRSEINERKTAEAKLFYMAFHDSLTGLPNREWIIQYIDRLLTRCQEEPDLSFGVMFLDGDRFKQINDTLGHVIGDQLLKASAKRLSDLLKENQYVGRLGGDEFTVIAESSQELAFETLAQEIIDEFKKPFLFDNHTLYFNVSIGIVKCDSHYKDVPEVLRNADIAMYRAKDLGRGTYQLFDKQIQKKTLEIAELEARLRVAVEECNFHLVYQPIINLETGLIQGFEALIRWQHPEKGLISPLTFIPIAEETGLIWDIGKWVLKEACKQTKKWHDMELGFYPNISVNLSTNQIRNADFLKMLDETIEDTGIDPKYLKLELTESVLIENNHALSLLYEALHDRKIDLAIDDFGTGYSSLAYLNEIPVQFLKIDKGFVEVIDQNSDSEINQDALEVIKAIISLGQSLRKQVVAEGIETKTQLSALIEHGCDFAQGYFMSKPLSAEDATKVIQSKKNIADGGVNIPKEEYVNEYISRSEK